MTAQLARWSRILIIGMALVLAPVAFAPQILGLGLGLGSTADAQVGVDQLPTPTLDAQTTPGEAAPTVPGQSGGGQTGGGQTGGGQTGTPPQLPPAASNTTPPALPQVPKEEYHYAKDGQPVGPVELPALQKKIQEREVKRDTLVWKKGTPDWQRADSFPELVQTLTSLGPDAATFKQFLLGTWEQEEENQNMQVKTIVRYSGDGSYNGTATFTAKNLGFQAPGLNYEPPSQTIAIGGQWEVAPLSNDRFSVSLTEQVQGGLGGKQTAIVRIVDDNTLVNESTQVKAIRVGR